MCFADTFSLTPGISVPPLPAYNTVESSRSEETSKSHAHIAGLCDVVRALSEKWIGRLALSTNIPQLYPEQYSHALFELGIRALRNCFRGATPSSFQDIFALMHVAMASTYVVHKDDHAYSWNTFLEEACQWQHLLPDVIEKETFVRVMGRLCHPQECTTSASFNVGFAIDDVLLPAEHATLIRLIGQLSFTGVDVPSQEEGDKIQQHSGTHKEQVRSSGISQSNVIIKGCADFLDGKSVCHIVLKLTDPEFLGRIRPRYHS